MDQSVVVFYGEDSFFIKSKVNQLIKQFDVDEYNFTSYDLDEVLISDAINDAQTIPFMSERKIVLIKNAHFLSTAKQKKKALEQKPEYLNAYLNAPTKETLLIITVPHASLDKRSKLYKKIQDVAQITECKLKGKHDLSNWAKRQLANAGLTIEPSALSEFIKRVNHSTELAFQEMRKLLLYAHGTETVDIKTIKTIITKNIEDNVYDMTNALLAKDVSKALEVYHDLIKYSEDPLRILSILVSKYREMLSVKTLLKKGKSQDGIQQHFHVSSGRAYYMVQNAKAVPMDKLEEHLKMLESLDFQIKSGRIDKKYALELFIMSA